MSLIKQLWLGITIILLLALGGSFFISVMSAKMYLQDQLQLKNTDNATALALAMTQMEKDPVTMELLITAQFDSGHYQRITLRDSENQIIIERVFTESINSSVPEWFTRHISLSAKPGVAYIQDGWHQFGTVTLESHSHFAWEALWQGMQDLLKWFLIATLCSGLIGTLILKYISRPLDMVVQQAEAISQKRFIVFEEPKTTEFQRLVRAMNSLSSNVKNLLEQETRQLEKLQRESQLDQLTGLPNRAHFLNLLDSKLTREDSDNHGVMTIVRVLNLTALNNHIGHARADQALRHIAAILHQLAERYVGANAGRLNGSDFTLVVPGDVQPERVANELAQQLAIQMTEYDLDNVALPVAACAYKMGEKRGELMSKLDGALAQAELKGDRAVVALTNETIILHRNLNEWRGALMQALSEKKLELASFPVKSAHGDIIHFEAPMRLELDDRLQPAGYFVHWAARLGLMPRIDMEVVKIAWRQLQHMQLPLSINLSAEALRSAEFREQLLTLLKEDLNKARDLWLEFPEACALRHMPEFRVFTAQLRETGCRVGLEHVGLEFTQIRELQDIGLHYLKIDCAIIRDLNTNLGNQQFVQNICKIGHSLEITMIAEGVSSQAEQECLFKLGMDAITGPIV